MGQKRASKGVTRSETERLLAILDAVLVEWPTAVEMLFARAKALLSLGQIGLAETAYRAVLSEDHHHFRALNDLGLLYSRYQHPAEAEVLLRAAALAHPRNALGITNLAYLIAARGDHAAARIEFERALEIDPEYVPALKGLRDSLEALGLDASDVQLPAAQPRPSSAAASDPFSEHVYDLAATAIVAGENDAVRALLEKLLGQNRRHVMLLWRLADFASRQYNYDAAVQIFRHALAIEPENIELQIGIATVYEEQGDFDAAHAIWSSERLRGALRVFPYTGSEIPVRLLTIASATHSMRYELIVDASVIQNTVIYTQAYADDQPLPPHDVVLCAVADAEADTRALAVARTILARTDAPVLNHPDVVERTSREEQSRRLAGIPGVATALVETMSRAALCSAHGPELLRERGFTFPLLLRSPGFHNGYYFDRVEDERELAAIATKLPTADVYAISFQQTRGNDGMTRKYRMMCIDGILYPIHLAVSPSWKVHYATSAMRDSASYREEEAAFLADPVGALGVRAMRALEAIADATGLDYGGIDFGIDAEGRVRVFEANAAMGIFVPDDDPRWDYRRAAFANALAATKRMFLARADRISASATLHSPQ